jgi:hypothetical protein
MCSIIGIHQPISFYLADDNGMGARPKRLSKPFLARTQCLLGLLTISDIGHKTDDGGCAVPCNPCGFNVNWDWRSVFFEVDSFRAMDGRSPGE